MDELGGRTERLFAGQLRSVPCLRQRSFSLVGLMRHAVFVPPIKPTKYIIRNADRRCAKQSMHIAVTASTDRCAYVLS